MRRKYLSFIVFVLFSLSLYAGSIKVSGYNIEIIGKTKEEVVRNLIVPEEVEYFDSEDDLLSALNDKRQVLENKRVFTSVSYEYEIIDSEAYVRFEIIDAKSFLIIPFPKYDSNYGLKLGAKMWNRNLFGTLTSLDGTLFVTIKDWNWSRPEIYGNVSLGNLSIGSTKLSLELEAEGSVGETLSDYSLYMDVSNIPLFLNSWLDVTYSLSSVDSGDVKNNIFLSLGGIKLNKVEVTPSFKSVFYKNEANKNYLLPSISVKAIELGGVGLEFNETIKISTKEYENSYSPEYLLHEDTISFNGGMLKDFSLSNTVKYKFKNGYDFLNEIKYNLNSVFSLHVAEDIYMSGDGSIRHFDSGVGVGESIKLGKNFELSSKLLSYIRSYSNGDYTPLYTLDVSLKGANIKWIGNYREGVSANISIKEAWEIKSGDIKADFEKNGLYDHMEVSLFKLLGEWFNPSARVLVNSYLRNDPDEDNSFIWGSSGTLGDELRGIRNDSVSDSNLLAIVANFNLLSYFPMPSIFSFVDCYANVFFDYGLVKNSVSSLIKQYYGVGVEGIGILKSYPSYPIRVSLGFDVSKLMKWIEDRESMDFYEIYLGMGFLF
ncbi:MAG: hypothetical protein PUD65_06000 [Spirochaetales bacterium]|nr:hypothetical protein [Spirochaetales bacterium]